MASKPTNTPAQLRFEQLLNEADGDLRHRGLVGDRGGFFKVTAQGNSPEFFPYLSHFRQTLGTQTPDKRKGRFLKELPGVRLP